MAGMLDATQDKTLTALPQGDGYNVRKQWVPFSNSRKQEVATIYDTLLTDISYVIN